MNKQNLGEKYIIRLKITYYFAAFTAFQGGVAIYAFYRNINDMALFHFFPKPLLLASLYNPIKTESIWSNMFIYNLPTGLWLFSGFLILKVLWYENVKTLLIYQLSLLFIAFLLEILQIFEGIPGTFDIFDLLSMGLFALLASILNKF